MAKSLMKRWLFTEISSRSLVFSRAKRIRDTMVDSLTTRPRCIRRAARRGSAKTRQMFLRLFLSSLVACSVVGVSQAATSPVDLCDDAARRAAQSVNVPANVLRTIARVETGRLVDGRLKPWPWTVNIEGKGYWFDSEDAAYAFVRAAYYRGARSFDIGCFQINYKWHGAAFGSFETMFDPQENAVYAAKFLQQLRSEFGSWSEAVGAYHSRRPQSAQGYRARFEQVQAGLEADSTPAIQGAMRPQTVEPILSGNGYPLLHRSDGTARPGSLVPMGETKRYVVRLDQKLPVGF